MNSVSITPNHPLQGKRVTVMGLGLHGGGLATTQFLVSRGAEVTVTDLRSEQALRPSLERLAGLPVRLRIGEHHNEDFANADVVVKNPAVRRTNPYLAQARWVIGDIGLFAAELAIRGIAPPMVGITGSKGKSTTASAAYHILQTAHSQTQLGGNITVSPLTFVDELDTQTPVVLELSSFQLGDLAWCAARNRAAQAPEWLTAPLELRVAIITNIMRDHQDYYGSMDAYVDDKRVIYRSLQPGGTAIFCADDTWTPSFRADTDRRVLLIHNDGREHTEGAYLVHGEGLHGKGGAARAELLVPRELRVPGAHARLNMLFAAAAAHTLGIDAQTIRAAAATYAGISHRLETVAVNAGVRFINDSAATIPEATAAAVGAFEEPVILIAGGTDKQLDLTPIAAAARAARSVILLAGSATDRMRELLDSHGLSYAGPFDSLSAALEAAVAAADTVAAAAPSDAATATSDSVATPSDAAPTTTREQEGAARAVVLFSPGCASFGMFLNEFDRGNAFRRLVQSYSSGPPLVHDAG